VNGVELPQRLDVVALGLRAPRADEDREELGVEPARAHLRQVELHVGLRLREVDAVVRDALRAVGVRVDDDRVAMQVAVGERGRGARWATSGDQHGAAHDGDPEARHR